MKLIVCSLGVLATAGPHVSGFLTGAPQRAFPPASRREGSSCRRITAAAAAAEAGGERVLLAGRGRRRRGGGQAAAGARGGREGGESLLRLGASSEAEAAALAEIAAAEGSESDAATSLSPAELPPGAPLDPDVTGLPDDFEDSVALMVKGTTDALEQGSLRLRIDYDTRCGDEMYTLLKSSLEFMQLFLDQFSRKVVLQETEEAVAAAVAEAAAAREVSKQEGEVEVYSFSAEEDEASDNKRKEAAAAAAAAAPVVEEEYTGPTLRVIFPDMGSAMLCTRNWQKQGKMKVPACCKFGAVGGAGTPSKIADSDVGVVLVCPRNSEADQVVQLVNEMNENHPELFLILVNPELVNMDTTGFGLAGRKIRDIVLKPFTTVYYLRSLEWGAVTRVFGKKYAVWQQDSTNSDGYSLLRAVDTRPLMPDIEEWYEIDNGLVDAPTDTPKFLNAINDFIRDYSRL